MPAWRMAKLITCQETNSWLRISYKLSEIEVLKTLERHNHLKTAVRAAGLVCYKSDNVFFFSLSFCRYDHYATLCELLPAALPSLAFCLGALSEGTCCNHFLNLHILEHWCV